VEIYFYTLGVTK